jgi:hypothetical protein
MSSISSFLYQDDCARMGWILHGFPRTRAQAQLLQREGVAANRVVALTRRDATTNAATAAGVSNKNGKNSKKGNGNGNGDAAMATATAASAVVVESAPDAAYYASAAAMLDAYADGTYSCFLFFIECSCHVLIEFSALCTRKSNDHQLCSRRSAHANLTVTVHFHTLQWRRAFIFLSQVILFYSFFNLHNTNQHYVANE